MKNKTILFFGNSNPHSTAQHRAGALERLGFDVIVYDPYVKLKNRFSSIILKPFDYRTGYKFIQYTILQWINEILTNHKNDNLLFVWIDQGEVFGKMSIEKIKKKYTVILYNNDDPTNGLDGHRFDRVKESFKYYDLIVVVREDTKNDFISIGAKNVIRVNMSYDEVMHSPIQDINNIENKFKSDIVFIGTWMRNEKRDEFLLNLVKAKLNVVIWGDRWNKSPYWNLLKKYYKGRFIGGRDYVAAIQGAKVCIGMLSKSNRDKHTQRSLEVPYAGGVLCAERTTEHLQMYIEGEEAVFWSDSEECIAICKVLLNNDILREKIRLSGMKRVRKNNVGNEDICRKILDEVKKIKHSNMEY